MLTVLSAALLLTIELLRSVPAWWRVRTQHSAAGLSPVSLGVLAGTGAGWLTVALLVHSLPALLATALWLVFHLLLCAVTVRAARATVRPLLLSAALSLLATALSALLGAALGSVTDALGLLLAGATVAYSLPALLAGLRSETTAGLSVLALSANSVEGGLYLIAGVGFGGIAPAGTATLAYRLFGTLALCTNAPRLARVGTRRLRHLP